MRDSSASLRRQAADAALQQRRRLRLGSIVLDQEQEKQEEQTRFNSAGKLYIYINKYKQQLSRNMYCYRYICACEN